MALEAFPPMTLVAVRFLISGGLMLLGARLLRIPLPRGRELRQTAWNGVIILGVGNSCLTIAELWIPSGLAALIITISPFWMLGLDAVLPPRVRLYGPTLFGMFVGLAGAALLVGPGALDGGFSSNIVKGFLLLQFGCFSWSFGSLVQRRQPTTVHPIVSGGVQQFAAGLAFLPIALLRGGEIHWNQTQGLWAILYLIVFGSIVGYSSYIYVLEHLPVAVLSIYNYVNPVVAVALGWLFYREPFGLREAAAMLIIFTGVAMVKRAEARRPAETAA